MTTRSDSSTGVPSSSGNEPAGGMRSVGSPAAGDRRGICVDGICVRREVHASLLRHCHQLVGHPPFVGHDINSLAIRFNQTRSAGFGHVGEEQDGQNEGVVASAPGETFQQAFGPASTSVRLERLRSPSLRPS